MSAVVAARQQPGSATHSAGSTSNTGSRMGTHSPVDNKRPNPKSEDKSSRLPDQSNSRGDVSKNAQKGLSPLSNQGTNSVHPHVAVDQPPDASTSGQSNNHGQQSARSLPNKPKIQAETPDYFNISHNSRLDQEPNPFEQSFASNSPKAILPPVTAITSPSSLLPGGSAGSGFNWGLNSLRSGPLSPAMLQGPASNSNVGSTTLSFDPRIRTGLTPNESGIRSGLTPGGSGPLFSAPSPATNALFQFIGGGTPGTMEFQRTALSAARRSTHPPPPLVAPHIKTEDRASNPDHSQQKQRQHSDGFHAADPAHNAASGLFLLARAKHPEQEDVAAANAAIGGSGPGYQAGNQVPSGISGGAGATTLDNTSPSLAKRALVNNASNAAMGAAVNRSASGGSIPNSVRGISEISDDFSDSGGDEVPTSLKRNTRAKNAKSKPSSSSTTARRKAEDSPGGGGRSQNKKAKGPQGQSMSVSGSDDGMDDGKDEGGKDSKKMTDEEKRKNFLERNRVAALKCRQRKKQWLASLQAKVELFSSENDALTAQVTSLREEIVSLKTLLLAHKDCPVARSNGGSMGSMDLAGNITGDYSHVPMMNHYGNVAGMGGCVMAPPGGARRYS